MPKLVFTQQEVNEYAAALFAIDDWDQKAINPNIVLTDAMAMQNAISQLPTCLHYFYPFTLWHSHKLRTHADGLFPAQLLLERRPNEPLEVLNYRKMIYVPKTKPTFDKVYSSLQKIRRSADWSIAFDKKKENQFTLIPDDESLEDYIMEDFPFFTSLTNWVFQIMLRKYLIDPNAVVFIQPINYEIQETDYYEPFPTIYDSINVLDYAEEDYCVLNDPIGTQYYDRKGIPQPGKAFWIITTMQIWRYEQVNKKRDFQVSPGYPRDHNLGILPALKLKGVLIDQAGDQFMYESKIAGMLPELDEAAREYSDLQAAKVLNIYPERWEYTNTECTECRGTGRVRNPIFTPECGCPETLTCDHCGGHGYVSAGPFSKLIIRPQNAIEGGQTPPTPPAGYIQKDTDTVKIQDAGVRQHLYDALGAINFQFLGDVPIGESGISKEQDRDESNNTTHGIAEDIVADMDSITKIICYWRYKSQYPDVETLDDMLPVINVPQNFSVLYTVNAEKELIDAKIGKLNPVILNQLELEYTSKKFNAEPDIRDNLLLVLSLDPFPNVTQDEKMAMLANNGITQEDYIISSNAYNFTQRALDEDPKFADKTLTDQKAVLKKYAQEQIAAASAKAKIIPLQPKILGNGQQQQSNQGGTPGAEGAAAPSVANLEPAAGQGDKFTRTGAELGGNAFRNTTLQ